MVGRKPLRRAGQGVTPEFVMLAKAATVRGTLPGRGIVDDEVPDIPQRVVFRMPQSRADETVARRDVQVERRRGDLAAAFVEDARAGPGLVRLLVVAEAGVALHAEQRTADLARIGAVMTAQFRDRRLQVRDQLQEGFAHVRFVVGLVRLEPGAVVVACQRAQEAEAGGREVAARHDFFGTSDVARHPGILAPSMALALRVAFGVRVCGSRIKSGTGSANAVAKRYPGPSGFLHQCITRKSLGSGLRRNDEKEG